MPDLITHTCVAYGLSVLCQNRWHTPVLVGAVMPDILSRVPGMVLSTGRTVFPEIPLWLIDVWAPLHLPIGIIFSSLILAILWEPTQRFRIFGLSLLGQASHLLLDLGQLHISGGYALGFPISNKPFELGWYGTEASIWVAPILLLVAYRHWKSQ